MTTLFIITTIIASGLGIVQTARLLLCESERDDYRGRWENQLRDRGVEDSLVFEWSIRDLMPRWEAIYPHVRNMIDARKYSEWATFCANYPTRDAAEAQLGIQEVRIRKGMGK